MTLFKMIDCRDYDLPEQIFKDGKMTHRLYAIAETFNFERECLELDLDQTSLTWDDVAQFLKENNMSHQIFGEYVLGGLIARETITRCINKRLPMSRMHRLTIILAFKFRQKLIQDAPNKHCRTYCKECGR